jgi:hypothetical protein
MSINLHIKKSNFRFFVFLLFTSLILLFFVGIPSFDYEIPLKFMFDSKTYLNRAENLSKIESLGFGTLYEMAISNSFGPVLLGYFAGNNYFLIYFFNITLYFVCSTYLIRALDLKVFQFHVLIFINLISWISIVSLNKEIFVFATFASLVLYFQKKTFFYLLLLVFTSLLVRTQMLIFSAVIVFVFSDFMLFKNSRKSQVFLFLGALSVLLPFYIKGLIESIEFWREQTMESRGNEGTNLYLVWINLDRKFLYFISFSFKLLHLTVLNAIQFAVNPKINLLYFHNFAETAQSFSFIILYFSILKNKLYKTLSNDFLYISFFYFIIFVTVQIFTPRYLYPGYILLTLLLTSRNGYLPRKFNNAKFGLNV